MDAFISCSARHLGDRSFVPGFSSWFGWAGVALAGIGRDEWRTGEGRVFGGCTSVMPVRVVLF